METKEVLPLRGTNSKQHMLYFYHILCLDALKGTAIILTAVILDFSTLSGTNLQILTPKRYDEHLRHFYMVVLPPRDLDQ